MTRNTGDRSKPFAALRDARATYRRLREKLVAEARRLGEGKESGAGGTAWLTLVQSHHKALQQLLDFETRIEKQISDRIGLARGEIDLEKARTEILGKLARLKRAIGSGGVAGRADA